MSRVQSFPAIAGPGAHTLILGSMPGVASLTANQYYAHPRNAFWPILGDVLDIAPTLPYPDRVTRLAALGYALWDVLQACTRPGSLDTAIDETSMEVNRFDAFFTAHPGIDRVFFNGTAAERIFRRRALPDLPRGDRLALHRLPSTSPANASIPLADKIAAWRQIAR